MNVASLEKTNENIKFHADQLTNKIQNKDVRVGVIGLGYVGLPFLLEKAKIGLQVIGYDHNQARVDNINSGISHIEDVDSATLSKVIKSGLIKATSDISSLTNADVIVISVPTPLDKNLSPDLTYVKDVAEKLVTILRPGQLISLESTTYPGTTTDVLKPILEKSGLTVGEEIFLAYSPERVDPGNARYTTKNTNKIVGGADSNSAEVAVAFYRLAIQKVIKVSSSKIAEMVKVYENTYRAVNIALVNEMALLCDKMELNVWEMLSAAFTKPFGIMPFFPGAGVGGHCIPIDPHYLEWKAKEYNFNTHFISLAGEINRRMPAFVIHKLTRLLNKKAQSVSNSKVVLFGVAYKPNVSDWRESPSLEIFKSLKALGATVYCIDPHVPYATIDETEIHTIQPSDALLKTADISLILTNHAKFNITNIVKNSKKVFDTCHATKGIQSDNIVLL